jgi:hypothetical protein
MLIKKIFLLLLKPYFTEVDYMYAFIILNRV